MKIIHITDFHLVPPGERLWGLDPCDRLDRCLNDIARWHGDADFCVMSGDLTNRGSQAAYGWIRERLEGFPLETILMIGNHDSRENFIAAFPETGTDRNGFVQSVRDTEHGVFLFLDTVKGPVSEGEYCEQRLAWFADELARVKGKPVWIFMHHPPFDVGISYMDRIKLEEPKKFADVLSAHGDVRHIFFGHIHRAAMLSWRGIPCTSLPGTNHQVPLISESVGGVYSVEPPMYGVILIDGDQTIVHFEACLDRSPVDTS
ncbi:MAG: phosphodiesterase [Hyphomicrobiaceae bacterium]|nr:phosphodiesterase [Hyphomicrobiaceae bacterium]